MTERLILPKPLTKPLILADSFMRPVMYGLGGFRPDSIQETHPWHVQDIDPALIDPELSVTVTGSPLETMKAHYGFLFHMPIIGGWKQYTLFEAAEQRFHIGWASRVRNKLAQAAIHRLPLFDGHVRMLNGPEGSETEFFAVNPDGEQIELAATGSGVLGDNQFPDTRLL